MRRMLMVVLSWVALGALVSTALAQRNPRGKTELTLNGTKISVEYGRPSLNGRTAEQMLSQLALGQVWRLGADQSTTFSTSGDLSVGSEIIPKGEYSLWARKEAADAWSLVFNKQHGQWGTDYDSKQDLAAMALSVQKLSKPVEQVTITLEQKGGDGELSIKWGDLELSRPFTTKGAK